MDKTKLKKTIFVILFLTVFFINMSSNVFAAINTEYGGGNVTSAKDEDLNNKISGSILISPLSYLIYSVGSIIENLVASAFESLTNQRIFPWADKIVFNTIPLLDVNFLNPSKNSLFATSSGEDTMIAKVLRNTYFSVYVLAIGFLGIVVAIMAIKLATSAIAAEKAKYKQALVKWGFSLVMLFCVHYLLSFIFFANEKMVEMASQIAKQQLNSVPTIGENSSSHTTAVVNFTWMNCVDLMKNGKEITKKYEGKIKTIDDIIAALKTEWKNIEPKSGATIDLSDEFSMVRVTETFLPQIKNNSELAYNLLNNDIIRENIFKYISAGGSDQYTWFENLGKWEFNFIQDITGADLVEGDELGLENMVQMLTDIERYNKAKKSEKESVIRDEWEFHYTDESTIVELKKIAEDAAGNEISNNNAIQVLGEFFKKNAWQEEEGEWDKKRPVIQNAILYAIFIIQSIMYFFTYLKRFFYVVILAMLAPVIVIYDFFSKSIV